VALKNFVLHNNTARQATAVLRTFLRWCFFVLMVMLCVRRVAAQTAADHQQTEDRLPRFDVVPLVGYRTIMKFPTGHEPSPGLILGARPSYGIAIGVRLDDENLIEFRWARQDTQVHLEGSIPPSDKRVGLDQFHGDFTHEYILEEGPHWARPFVVGSVGATHVGGTSSRFTRFSFGLGAGLNTYISRHVGFRVQGEWLPVVVQPEVTSFFCGSNCVVRLAARLVSQGEIAVGPVFRF
jgi:hypothetical protein